MALRTANAGKASRTAALTTVLLAALLSASTLEASEATPVSAFDFLIRSGSFRLSGDAEGLYPGAQVPVRVKVANPKGFPIKVTRVSMSVGADPAHPDCSPDDHIWTTAYRGALRVPPRSGRRVTLTIGMLAGAPDACQGASFTIRYTAKAERA